ncbi:MAG TPA: biotin--[acetyl-CoA-carboxylase] ligase [Solirubrobacteraceae bacterium]|jgi:BirA family biotin operon repressor/biotin-[acetyl-CoA-carboxylase] ligase|nr:biotin--[acetyl-CoA-carboxylase] ligase [Solirubrobacteraceae bacterium]
MSAAPDGKPRAKLGRPRLHLRRTDSTNDRARELAAAGAPHGTLVTAGEQTAGRGRQGRRWSAPAGSALLMSLLVRSPPPLLPLIAAVAVCDVAGDDTWIKWPNDVVVAQPPAAGHAHERAARPLAAGPLAKLAGILVEARPQEAWAVLGIGLNVAVELDQLPAELRPATRGRGAGSPLPAATLGLPREEIEPTLSRLLGALERRLAEPAEATLEAWRARDALRGREIAWAGGRGRAHGIDGTGRLVVALEDGGQTTLSAGEVHLRAMSEAG